MDSPYLIKFPRIGQTIQGYISIAEKENLPFDIKRIYWTYFTPENITRGGHAHHNLEQILVAVAGTIWVTTEVPGEEEKTFVLDAPDKGLYIPKCCWRTMRYVHNSVQVCFASMVYEESDYIRDYDEFKKIASRILVPGSL